MEALRFVWFFLQQKSWINLEAVSQVHPKAPHLVLSRCYLRYKSTKYLTPDQLICITILYQSTLIYAIRQLVVSEIIRALVLI